jgi:hypothetical protein
MDGTRDFSIFTQKKIENENCRSGCKDARGAQIITRISGAIIKEYDACFARYCQYFIFLYAAR